MCRFVLYLGPPILLSTLVTEPANSLIHQSFHSHEREEPLNGDGFGVAWYKPELCREAGIFRSVTPAWSNQNLQHLARMTRSGCVLAHVRAATPGLPVAEANTHPFSFDRFAFMHNGEVGAFRRIRRPLLDGLSDEAYGCIQGTTDSEHLFALFIDSLLRAPEVPNATEAVAAALGTAVRRVLALIERSGPFEPSYLNLAVADGHRAVACRFTSGPPEEADSLYLHTGKRYICEAGVCRMVEPETGHQAVLVSSEPLSDDPGWSPVPVNHLVAVHEGGAVDLRPL